MRLRSARHSNFKEFRAYPCGIAPQPRLTIGADVAIASFAKLVGAIVFDAMAAVAFDIYCTSHSIWLFEQVLLAEIMEYSWVAIIPVISAACAE